MGPRPGGASDDATLRGRGQHHFASDGYSNIARRDGISSGTGTVTEADSQSEIGVRSTTFVAGVGLVNAGATSNTGIWSRFTSAATHRRGPGFDIVGVLSRA